MFGYCRGEADSAPNTTGSPGHGGNVYPGNWHSAQYFAGYFAKYSILSTVPINVPISCSYPHHTTGSVSREQFKISEIFLPQLCPIYPPHPLNGKVVMAGWQNCQRNFAKFHKNL